MPHRVSLTVGFAVLCLLAPSAAQAQTTARDSVVATLQRAFDAMRARDTTALRATLDSTALLFGVPDDATRPMRPRTVSQFLRDVATTPADKAFDERMFDPEVRVEGPLAQLWTYYTFREGRTFSHCGIDAVTLARARDGWRIVHWIWSVRRTGCTRTE